MFAAGLLALLLLIPTGMITNLIKERADKKDEAIAEVQEKWGKQQIIAGPVLTNMFISRKINWYEVGAKEINK